MNGAHYHLVVNHLPIIIPVIGLLVLIGGFIVQSEIVKSRGIGFIILCIRHRFDSCFMEQLEKEILC